MDLTGRVLGTYQIVEELGRGGMAVVHRAYQASLNRYVAIKVLPPQLAFDRQFVERFVREARAAASLRHPNIVVVHDVGEQDGLYYIVMEYLEGQTLKDVIEQQGPLPPLRVAHILDQVASALDYAHQRGFVHRDVKPANIFLAEGDRVTLTDFGIAKAVSEAEQLTRTGTLVGTPEYMAPEQAEGGPVDHRTDLYALGIVLYQMLTGQVPFRGNTPNSTLYAVVHQPPPPPRQINPALPSALEAVVLQALAKAPDQRFQRGAEMAGAFRSALPDKARLPVEPRPGVKARPQSPLIWIVAALAAVLVLTVVGLALLLGGGGGEKASVQTPSQVVVWQSTPTAVAEAAFTSLPEVLQSGVPSETPPSEPTDAPVPTDTAQPSSTPTDTDTPSPPTETPTSPPSATPAPTHTPAATSTPPCPIQAQGLFADLWQAHRVELGCPLYAKPKAIQDAEQAFDNGHMFWRADTDRAYVVYEQGSHSGTYQWFANMWQEDVDQDYSCPASPPPGKVQPKRGFGAVWCSLGGASASIGWGLGEEAGKGPGNGDPLVQDFERGTIFRDSDGMTQGKAYVLFGDGSFKRLKY